MNALHTVLYLVACIVLVLFLVGCNTSDLPWFEDRADRLAFDITAAKAEVANLERELDAAKTASAADPANEAAASKVVTLERQIDTATPLVASAEGDLTILRKRIEAMRQSDEDLQTGIMEAARSIPGPWAALIGMGIALVMTALRSRANRKAGQDLARSVAPLVRKANDNDVDKLRDGQSATVKAIVRESTGKKSTPWV